MPDQDPVSPEVIDGGEEQDEPRTPKQRTAWGNLQAERDRYKREADQARQAASSLQAYQQQNVDLQNRLRQIELTQRTAGLPEEQQRLAVIQSQLEDQIARNQQLQQAAQQERSQFESALGPMARRQVAITFIEDLDLPPKIETPTGTEKTSEYLMHHPQAQTPEGMEALAKKIAANLKKNGTTAQGNAKAPAGSSKFLGAGGGGASGGRVKSAAELTSAEFLRVRELKTKEGLSHEEAMRRVSTGLAG